jgi:molecular chaperone DnaK (HSP70)
MGLVAASTVFSDFITENKFFHMKINKNTFSTLVLDLFCQSTANCKKLKIQKIQKSTSPTKQSIG